MGQWRFCSGSVKSKTSREEESSGAVDVEQSGSGCKSSGALKVEQWGIGGSDESSSAQLLIPTFPSTSPTLRPTTGAADDLSGRVWKVG